MIQDSVWIPTKDGKKMEGLLRKPDGTGPFPAVVFVSGLGMTMHEGNNSFDEISKLLVAQGIMTVQFTFPIFDKNGLCRELPLMKRGEITRNVLSWVSGRNDVDKNRLGILAQSYGAATVLGIHPEDVRTFLFVSGAYFPKQSIAQVYREKRVKLNYSGDTSLPRSSGENTTVGKNFWEDIEHFDDIGNAKQIHQPVFMAHGDQDSKIPVEHAQKVFDAIASSTKRLKVYTGGDHGIVDVPRPLREEFLQDAVAWFKETLT